MTKDFKPDPTEKLYTFDDVQGVDEAKSEVEEIVDFLRNPEKFQRLGAKLPTGSQSDCVVSVHQTEYEIQTVSPSLRYPRKQSCILIIFVRCIHTSNCFSIL